jgi:hypothetical protein
MILFLPEPLICAPPISASAVVGRNARLGLLWCVGHAHTTEAIPGMHPRLVAATAAANRDALLAVERVKV